MFINTHILDLKKITRHLLLGVLWGLLLAGCNSTPEEATPAATEAAIAEATIVSVPPTAANAATNTPIPTSQPPATFTAVPTATEAPATATNPPPTDTPGPTETPLPTDTPTPLPATDTPEPPPATNTSAAPPPTQPPAPPPSVPSNPTLGGNILPNASFEEGWYHTHGIVELQTPNQWLFEWDEGPTGYGGEAWDVWVRPEMRVLAAPYLPAHEHPLFIYDGNQTVKVFKGSGAISFRLMTDVHLEPGTYLFEINLFPDLYSGSGPGGEKYWADDPFAGEVRFITPDGGSGWLLPAFGQRNTMTHTFTVTSAQGARVGVGLRGRYALANNGWFIDHWSLKRVEN